MLNLQAVSKSGCVASSIDGHIASSRPFHVSDHTKTFKIIRFIILWQIYSDSGNIS